MNCRWIVAGPEIMEKLVVAKQAADLHSNELSQRIVHRFLCDNDVKAHIQLIRDAYRRQRDLTVGAVKSLFPPAVTCTEPEGGMFLWVTLPREMSAMTFFEKALAHIRGWRDGEDEGFQGLPCSVRRIISSWAFLPICTKYAL